ncbi:MAG TPA: hypothetical protein VNZ44_15615 [Pyrinomonadaceae bacterium]|nr:hypothetical protein [Pyrinomonadaceae bacterium]
MRAPSVAAWRKQRRTAPHLSQPVNKELSPTSPNRAASGGGILPDAAWTAECDAGARVRSQVNGNSS